MLKIFSFLFLLVSFVFSNQMEVYKSPSCGCCQKWIDYINKNGIKAIAKNTNDLSEFKKHHPIPKPLHSCHTGIINGLYIEGHVPFDALNEFLNLKDKKGFIGIGVAGMPMRSPGMSEPPYKNFSVYKFKKDGSKEVFKKY